MNWSHDARVKEDPRNGRSGLCGCMVNRDRQSGDGWHGKSQEGRKTMRHGRNDGMIEY